MIYTPTWLSKLQLLLSLPLSWVKPILAVQWAWGTAAAPDYGNIRFYWFTEPPSLYMNGVIFFSVKFPFFVNFMFRWSSTSYLQTHIGWRPVDGSPVIVFRIQTDASAQGGLTSGYLDGSK